MQRVIRAVILVATVALASQASADTIVWANWTRAAAPTNVYGTLNGASVTYTGDAAFAQLNNAGTYYWTGPSRDPNNPVNPYLSAVVSNLPLTSDLIGLNPPATHTITFDRPIMNPVMAIVSLGQVPQPVTYAFLDAAGAPMLFTILSSGPGWWGGPGLLSIPSPGTLAGPEGDGVIQFAGPISTIRWVSGPNEYWHGVTVGEPVPEPASLTLLGLGLAGIARAARRRKK